MTKHLEYTKIAVGLLPIVSILIYIIHWFVIGTMEHGWLCDAVTYDKCSHPWILVTQVVLVFLACIAAVVATILGAREAHIAWKRLRGGRG